MLVTDNTRDFPDKAVAHADFVVLDVADALILPVDSRRDKIADVVTAQIAALRRPPLTLEAFVDRLAPRTPHAATRIGATIGIDKYQRMLAATRDTHNQNNS